MLVVDACRHVVRGAHLWSRLATRPVLFALARALAEAWPGDVTRETLVHAPFRAKHADESHRARLRVEIGRLRTTLRSLASVSATKHGFALAPRHARDVVVLAPPVEDQHAAVIALLADGEVVVELGAGARAWRQRSAPCSVRSMKLATAGKVQSLGRGRARRWMTPPLPGFPTTLLLPGPLPSD